MIDDLFDIEMRLNKHNKTVDPLLQLIHYSILAEIVPWEEF